jgi:hypothetical protein
MTPRSLFFAAICASLGCESTIEIPPPDPNADTAASRASREYPTYRDLHAAVAEKTCGPRSGVCHNSKQFPDLHTPENMLAVVGQRCNQLTEDPTQVQDLCEPNGDLLQLDAGPDKGFQSRIGYVIDRTTATPATIVLTLHDAPPHDASAIDADIVRDADPGATLHLHLAGAVTTKAGVAQVVLGASNLSTSVRAFFTTPYTPGFNGQVFLGDPNRNGIFGASLGGALVSPGAPDRSFLVWRLTGKVGPQMPLANGPLTDEQIYAMQCWIQQLAPDASNADGPIDYSRCPATFPTQ